jgi:hypothetical protein
MRPNWRSACPHSPGRRSFSAYALGLTLAPVIAKQPAANVIQRPMSPELMTVSNSYPLGYTEDEARRLADQAALLEDLTKGVLRRAGIGAGMRVLGLSHSKK